MAHYRISKTRIMKLNIPKGYDIKNIQSNNTIHQEVNDNNIQ